MQLNYYFLWHIKPFDFQHKKFKRSQSMLYC